MLKSQMGYLVKRFCKIQNSTVHLQFLFRVLVKLTLVIGNWVSHECWNLNPNCMSVNMLLKFQLFHDMVDNNVFYDFASCRSKRNRPGLHFWRHMFIDWISNRVMKIMPDFFKTHIGYSIYLEAFLRYNREILRYGIPICFSVNRDLCRLLLV